MSAQREMFCDRVWEELTMPGAGAASSPAVAEHLADCPECRRMAAAISPAVELFRAADPTAHVVPPLGGSCAVIPPEGGTTNWTFGRPGKSVAHGLTLLGTLAAGLLMGALLVGVGGQSPSGGGGENSNAPSLQSLGLVAACWQGDESKAANSIACCTQCHTSQRHASKGTAKVPSVATAASERALPKLLLSCQICHTP